MVARNVVGPGEPSPTAVLVSWRDKGFNLALVKRLRECGLSVTRAVPPDFKEPLNGLGETVAVILRESSKEKDGRDVALKKATKLGMKFVLLPPTEESAWEHVFAKGKVPFVLVPAAPTESDGDTGKSAAERRAQQEAEERRMQREQENEELNKAIRELVEKELSEAEEKEREARQRTADLRMVAEASGTLNAPAVEIETAEEEERKASEVVRLAKVAIEQFRFPEASQPLHEDHLMQKDEERQEEGTDPKAFGIALRTCREGEAKVLTQAELAKQLGIRGANTAISRDELGGRVSLERYMKYLGRYPSLAKAPKPRFVRAQVEIGESQPPALRPEVASGSEPPPVMHEAPPVMHEAPPVMHEAPSVMRSPETTRHLPEETKQFRGFVSRVPGLERLATAALALNRDFSLVIRSGLAVMEFGTTIHEEGAPEVIVPEARRQLEMEIDEILRELRSSS